MLAVAVGGAVDVDDACGLGARAARHHSRVSLEQTQSFNQSFNQSYSIPWHPAPAPVPSRTEPAELAVVVGGAADVDGATAVAAFGAAHGAT